MQITLYGGSPFDRSGKIRWLLEELGVEYRNNWLNADEEYERFLKIAPLGRSPAIAMDGKVMIESGAIGEYLADLYPEKGLAPRLESQDRGSYLELLQLGMSIGSISVRMQIIEDIPEGDIKAQKTDRLFEELSDSVEFVGKTLGKKDYVLGTFSAADVFLGYHLYYASLWPEMNEIIERNNTVSRYLKMLKGRKAAIASRVFTYDATSGSEKDEP